MPRLTPLWAGVDPILGALHGRTRVRGGSGTLAGDPPPAPKTYPRMPRTALQRAESLPATLVEALEGRCSARRLAPDSPVSLTDLSQLLHWSAGPPQRARSGGAPSRFYPSAGARYPLEVYVAARLVSSLPPAVYHWQRESDALETLPVSPSASDWLYAALEYPWHREAAALIVVTARMAATLVRYGSRGYRFVLIEAGALLQNLGLVTAALGLGGSLIGTAWDTEGERILALDSDDEVLITGFAVGRPAAGATVRPEGGSLGRKPPPAVTEPRDSGPARVSLTVPLRELSRLPLWDGSVQLPGMTVLAAAEQVLGVRLGAELPRELLELPADAWPSYPKLKRLAESGLSPRWSWGRSEPDEPRLDTCCVTLGAAGHGPGTDAVSPAVALDRAIGESIERWVWREAALPAARLHVGSPRSLNGTALPLESVAGYSPALRAAYPERLAWTEATELVWVGATSAVDGGERLVPLQLVSAHRGAQASAGIAREPEIRPRVTTGLAAHPDRTRAILNGLLEVVERDAFMLTWLCRLPADTLDLHGPPHATLADLCERFRAAHLEPHVVTLRTDVPVPVVLGLIHDPTGVGPCVAVGAAARPSVAGAAVAALTEAFASWRSIRRRLREGCSAPADPSQLDREGRLLWWAQPQQWLQLRWLLEGARTTVPAEAEEPSAEAELDRLLAWFRQAREDVLVVDLTDEALAYRLGHHVVGVVAPGFHPVHLDERRPALWSERLRRAQARRARAPDAGLNLLPHPFP